MPMARNLKRIAQELDLSISTVSRVLNNKENVNSQTREKVLDYLRANDLEGGPASDYRGKTVAVAVPDLTEDYFAGVIRGIENILWREGSAMVLCDTGENPEKEAKCLELFVKKKFDGVILATVGNNRELLKNCQKHGVNLVFFDNLPDMESNYNCVLTDNIKSSILAVNHLHSLGHRVIGTIAGRQEETTGFERLVGYRRAMQLGGLEVRDGMVEVGDFKEASGYTCMRRLMDNNPDLTAVYVHSAKMTCSAIKAILDSGRRVPEDIAVVGFDIHDDTGLLRPAITTILQNEAHIGMLCVELLRRSQANRQNGRRMPDQKILLEPTLVVRESCGAIYRKNTREP